jgi:hypothetical protein
MSKSSLQNFTCDAHYLTAGRLHCWGIATIIRPIMKRLMGPKAVYALLLCAASAIAAGRSGPETFFIPANSSGWEATIKLPVGAVSSFSATNAEALTDYAGPEIEAMRLSGDVRIDVIGTGEPIQIKADRVVLELTADETVPRKGTPKGSPGGSLPLTGSRQLHSSRVIDEGDAMQTFLGDVVFTLQTSSGAMQIKADRVEHTVRVGERADSREDL